MAQLSTQSQGDDTGTALAGEAPRRSAVDRAILHAGEWFAARPRTRNVVVAVVLLGAFLPSVVLLAVPGITDRLEALDYPGIFLMNLVSTSTVAVPVPALTAAAQAAIIDRAADSNYPWLIGLLGGLGMGLGEVTAYYAGYLGAELAKGREIGGPGWFQRSAQRAVAGINWLMRRWGMATLFVLSAIPNPLFEIAGLTAGSVRMPFRRFLAPVVAGKVLRGLLLAYIGTQLPFL